MRNGRILFRQIVDFYSHNIRMYMMRDHVNYLSIENVRYETFN